MTKDDDLREFQRNVERAQDARWAELRRRHRIHEQFEGRPDVPRQWEEDNMLGTLAQHLLGRESIETVVMIIEALVKSDPQMPSTDASEGAAAEIVGFAYRLLYGPWPWEHDEEEGDEQ
jgi:hypothetical protein